MKYLVTSALPYVNNVPHLGHFIGCVLPADVYSRFLKLAGETCVYVCGTDEYGTTSEVEALKQGTTPKELCDRNHEIHKESFEKLGCDFDIFSRTPTEEHTKVVQDFYYTLKQNNYIYRKEIEQLYCEKCQRFLPDRYVEGTCPFCGFEEALGDQCEKCGKVLEPTKLLKPKCTVCGGKPTKRRTEHIFFELSKLTEQLQEFVEKTKMFSNAKNFATSWLKEGLEDRCISRELKWGIKIPDIEGRVFYCWFDAPLGYVTFTKQIGKENWWHDKNTKIVHFLGKDNIAFHTIFFPGMLIAAGNYVLPSQIASYEFLNYEGKKFSKSKRVGVFCPDAIKIYPADYWRYYLISILTEHRDSDFTWEGFQKKINNDLNDVLGNFIHRTLTLVKNAFKGEIPKPSKYSKEDEKILRRIKRTTQKVSKLMYQIRIKKALNEAMSLARLGNQYLTLEEPWKNKEKANTVLYVCLNISYALSILLEPFMPGSAKKIQEFLGLNGKYVWQDASKMLEPGKKIREFKPLFRKIEDKEVEEYRKRFGGEK